MDFADNFATTSAKDGSLELSARISIHTHRFTRLGAMTRKPTFDPRTVAREIPGLFESIFPQLTPGVVLAFNRDAQISGCEAIPADIIAACSLQPAMLFEIGFALGEMLASNGIADWQIGVDKAIWRQRRHFDARIPESIPAPDREVAERVGINIAFMLRELEADRHGPIEISPKVPGFEWISSGNGDFAIGHSLIEIKCAARNFSAADYRQLTMYWLLSYASAIESNNADWSEGVLANPRTGRMVMFEFDEFLSVIGAGRTKADMLAQFFSMVSTRHGR